MKRKAAPKTTTTKVVNIPKIEWCKKDCSPKIMRQQGFKYYIFEDLYELSFPIYPMHSRVSGCFICKIVVYNDSHNVKVDLYKENIDMNNVYSQFYDLTNQGYSEFIDQINNIILIKFKELGIYKKRKTYQRRINSK